MERSTWMTIFVKILGPQSIGEAVLEPSNTRLHQCLSGLFRFCFF
jgi:hypothetical protein